MNEKNTKMTNWFESFSKYERKRNAEKKLAETPSPVEEVPTSLGGCIILSCVLGV